MALPKSGKRRYNVRCNSSSSSVDSYENNAETGYVSDSSTSDSEFVVGASRTVTNTGEQGFKIPRIVKSEFVLTYNKDKCIKLDENTYPASRRGKCFSKNAINARLNRIRKKKHMEEMEEKLALLSEENTKLKEDAKKRDGMIENLKTELQYMKSVLANSKELGILVKAVRNSGLPVKTSLTKEGNVPSTKDSMYAFDRDISCSPTLSSLKDPNADLQDPFLSCSDLSLSHEDQIFDQSDALQPFLDFDLPSDNAGVCLHVSQGTVSLEFCAHCSKQAQTATEGEIVR